MHSYFQVLGVLLAWIWNCPVFLVLLHDLYVGFVTYSVHGVQTFLCYTLVLTATCICLVVDNCDSCYLRLDSALLYASSTELERTMHLKLLMSRLLCTGRWVIQTSCDVCAALLRDWASHWRHLRRRCWPSHVELEARNSASVCWQLCVAGNAAALLACQCRLRHNSDVCALCCWIPCWRSGICSRCDQNLMPCK